MSRETIQPTIVTMRKSSGSIIVRTKPKTNIPLKEVGLDVAYEAYVQSAARRIRRSLVINVINFVNYIANYFKK